MKKQHWFLLALLVCVLVGGIQSIVLAAGSASMTVTNQTTVYPKHITFEWVCEEDGEVSGDESAVISGIPIAFVTYPSATAPTANYDLTLVDENGNDILCGTGANRASAADELVVGDSLAPFSNTTLELKALNAGSYKGGTAILYYR